MERNAVRYYLAVVSYRESRSVPDKASGEWRAQRWYGLTQTYAKQLHEVEPTDSLENKRREFAQQATLQAQTDSNTDSVERH